MPVLHKINFNMDIYKNYLVDDDINVVFNNTKIFDMPQAKDYLTIFLLINDFDDTTHAQLVNCIASIKMQTYLNINIAIINSDEKYYSRKKIKKISKETNSEFYQTSSSSLCDTLDSAISNCSSKYVSLIDFTDVIPRVRDIEQVVNCLFQSDYDYLTLIINYKFLNDEASVIQFKSNSILKSTQDFHYSAFFKTSKLKNFRFADLSPKSIDEKMIVQFIKDGLKGNHILSETEMTFLGELTQKN